MRRVLTLVLVLAVVTLAYSGTGYLTHGGSYDSAMSGGLAATGINGNSTGNTTVFTNASGTDFYVTEVNLILTSVSGLGTPPVISVGITAAAYTDFVSAFALTNLTTANTLLQPTLVGTRARVPNGTALVCRVATAAIATTTYTFTIVVRGFYL